MIWFPTLQLSLLYSEVPINEATDLGIFCYDNNFYIIPLYKKILPEILDSNIQKYFKTNIPISDSFYCFQFKMFKYIYNPEDNSFKAILFKIKTSNDKINLYLSNGIKQNEYNFNLNIYGKSSLGIEIPGFIKLLFIEFTDPFYLFQVFSVILWLNNDYEAYAYVIICATIISLISAVIETRSNLKDIQEMAKFECRINVYRVNDITGEVEKTRISSDYLVPGDVFELPENGSIIPCDAILLNGNCIINESTLTGETTPMYKSHINNNPINYLFIDYIL